MDESQTSIKFNIESWNIKVRERRNERMRIQINLNKDEGLAYKNFGEVCKPEDVSDSDFMKTIFLMGIEAMNKDLSRMIKDFAKENKEDLALSGITVIEGDDGDIKIAPTEVMDQDASGASEVKPNILHDETVKEAMFPTPKE